MSKQSRSPLKFRPLRVAGESIDRELDDVITDQFVVPFMAAVISKPERGECRITVTDGRVAANGSAMDRDPVTQARAQARWLYNFLSETQFKCFVQPVVVFPGWYVEPFDMKSVGVWVIELKALDSFIERQALSLGRDQMKAMASALSSYIRTQSAL